MNKIKTLFLKILQGKVIYHDKIVPVVIKDYWYDNTPCITITGFNRDRHNYPRQQVLVKRPLPKYHELYDKTHPDKKYPHLAEQTRHSYEVQINIWCNNEKEREIIVNQVKKYLFLARNSNYLFCMKYDSETHKCKTINEECKSRTSKGFKNLRGLCPNPRKYHCCNIFRAYDVIKNTIEISDDFEQDEYTHKPPLKRSIIEVNLDYNEVNVFPSNPMLCYSADFN